ncbi:MAG: type II toxin-antitoxin system death-on-curing family toxin [Chloroflexota bacterium]
MASEPEDIFYLDLEDVLLIYAELFDCSVDKARFQLSRPELLESALAKPLHYALYQEADLALQAAALAHGVAENQAFLDGNKRMAHLTMLLFLDENGYELEVSDHHETALAAWIIDLSDGLTPDGLAARLRPLLRAKP